MAFQTLEGGGLWVPDYIPLPYSIENNVFILDAAGEKAVVVLRCPKAGVLDRFDFLIATVTDSPDNGLRASFQGVSATDGQNDGTILGATNNAFVTYAHTVTTGWKSTNFGETVTVTRGQLIACVVDIPSFTAGDSVALNSLNHGGTSYFPYGISATSTKQVGRAPIIGLHYTDGYAFISPLFPGGTTYTSMQYNSGTGTADEWGMGFQLPFPCKLNGIGLLMGNAAGADHELLVYDAADGVLSTLTIDADTTGTAGSINRGHVYFLQSELTLSANTTYRVTLRPTTANSVQLEYMTFASAELMHTLEGGDNFYMTSRLNQTGSWTDYNAGTFRRPRISLYVSSADDAVSAGGGGGRVIGS